MLIALGTSLTYYGAYIKNSKENEKMAVEIKKEIQELKQEPPSEKKQKKLDELEKEFEEWGDKFFKDKDFIKKKLDKTKADQELKELELSREYRGFYSFSISVMKGIIDEYNKRTDKKIDYEFPDLPDNLFSEDISNYEAKISFKNNLFWKILISGGDNKEGVLPYLRIFIVDKETRFDFPKVLIIASFTSEDFTVNLEPPYSNFIKLEDSYSLEDYKKDLKYIFTKIMEYQFIEIEGRN